MSFHAGEVTQLPASTLAYIGDAVYELYVRETMLSRSKAKSGRLHALSVHYVKAKYQAAAAVRILPQLSEKEENVLLRGRNADPGAMPKHAAPQEYRWATGLEALIGYLYLSGEEARLQEVLALIMDEDLNHEPGQTEQKQE